MHFVPREQTTRIMFSMFGRSGRSPWKCISVTYNDECLWTRSKLNEFVDWSIQRSIFSCFIIYYDFIHKQINTINVFLNWCIRQFMRYLIDERITFSGTISFVNTCCPSYPYTTLTIESLTGFGVEIPQTYEPQRGHCRRTLWVTRMRIKLWKSLSTSWLGIVEENWTD